MVISRFWKIILFKPYYNITKTDNTIEKIKQGYFYADSWTIDEFGQVELQALDQALKQLKGKYPNKGDWDEQDLITALESVMKKSNIPFGIGAREPNPLGDIGYQRRMAINDALLDLARNFGPDKNKNVTNVTLSGFGGRVFFTNADGYVYVLVY